MNVSKKKMGFKMIVISCIFLPLFQVLFFIGINSKYLIKLPVLIILLIFIVLLIINLVFGINLFVKNRLSNKRRLKKWLRKFLGIIFSLYVIGCIVFCVLLYGPNEKFKTWLITTAMQTMNHQYLCKIFYSNKQIDEILSKNYVLESGESTDTDLINKEKKKEYIDEYDKQILDVADGEKYKIITFEVDGQNAYLAAIYDPSMVKLAVTEQIGVIGEYVTHMVQRTGAMLAINAGGFVDAGNNLGESPTGITIVNHEIITDNTYGTSTNTGGIIGFTDDDVLVLLKNKTALEAVELGVRDAVTWGPFLVVNGEASTVSGNGGWGYGARTAIGQRADGIVLFLVIDSNASRTRGADMADLTEIMVRYHAVNAANMDGGTSSVMVLPRDIAINKFGADCHDYFSGYACNINDPIDATGTHQTRYIADAWIVVE